MEVKLLLSYQKQVTVYKRQKGTKQNKTIKAEKDKQDKN